MMPTATGRRRRLAFVARVIGLVACALHATARPASPASMTIGGPGDDVAVDAALVPGGGLLVVGQTRTSSSASWDAWVLRLDADLQAVWSRALGGPGTDVARAIEPVDGGGFIVVGESDSFGAGDSDGWAFRIDEGGNVAWQVVDGVPGLDEGWQAAAPARRGGVMAMGYVVSPLALEYQTWLVELRSDGIIQSDELVGEGAMWPGPSPHAIAATSNGTYLLLTAGPASTVRGSTAGCLMVARISSARNLVWRVGDEGGQRGAARDAAETSTGDFIIVGEHGGNSVPDLDVHVWAIDDSGQVSWWRTFGSPEGQEWTNAVLVLADDSIMVGGATTSTPGNDQDGLLLALDTAGAPRWLVSVGRPGEDEIRRLLVLPDGRVAAVGSTVDPLDGMRDAWLLTFDPATGPTAGCALGLDSFDGRPATRLASCEDGTWRIYTRRDTIAAPSTAGALVSPTTAADPCSSTTLDPPDEVSPPGSLQPLLVRAGGALAWEQAPASRSETFHVYRGLLPDLRAGRFGQCLLADVAVNAGADASLPGPGRCWFYLITGRNAAGEGPMGTTSLGGARSPVATCR